MEVTLWIYDHRARRARLFTLPTWEQMPFVERVPLPVCRFLGRARTSFAWSDRRALEALDALARAGGPPFAVCRAFADPARPGPRGDGTAFDVGRELTGAQRAALRCAALRTGRFYRVETDARAPDCLRLAALAPRTLEAGDVGADVCRLQALLLRAGAQGLALSGTFCERTRRAARQAAMALGLPADGRADARLLERLIARAR